MEYLLRFITFWTVLCSSRLQPLYGVLLIAQSVLLCFLLVTMLFHAKVLLNVFVGNVCFIREGVEVKSLYDRCRPQVLDCMLSSKAGKMQHSSACTEMGQGPFWNLNFD